MAKVTTAEMKKRIFDRVGDEYELVSEYVRGNQKVDLLHKKCGKIYPVTTNHFFYDGSRCKCQLNIKQPEVFAKEFKDIAKGEYTQLSPYHRNTEHIEILHHVCGEPFKMTPKDFLAGNRCSNCFANKLKTTAQFAKEVEELSDGEYVLKSDYVNNRVKVDILHNSPNCGETYPVTPKDYLRGNRCPYCKQSKGERLVRNILRELNEPFEIEKSFPDLKTGSSKLPYDFYLTNLNALIEYDGVQHFEAVKRFGGVKKLNSQKRRDAKKNEYAKNNNMPLLRVPYTYTTEQVKNAVESFLKEVKRSAPTP